jgi:hypothetical protein
MFTTNISNDSIISTNVIEIENNNVKILNEIQKDQIIDESSYIDVKRVFIFLTQAALIGTLTGFGVSIFKESIFLTSIFFYENLANVLPRPAFYWPLAVCMYFIL